MEEAAREDLIGRPRWMRHRGFGCVFGLLFLFVIGSLVAGMAIVVSRLGPIPGIVALLVVVAVLGGMGRTLFLTARTLDRLVEATRRVEAGDYTVRVDVHPRSTGGLQVVGQLTDGFDTMIRRLEADEVQRRTLLADISHELRTPLSVVQGNLEAIVDGVYPPDPEHLAVVLDETRVLGRLIDDLRTLALSEAGTLALHPEPTDPDVLVPRSSARSSRPPPRGRRAHGRDRRRPPDPRDRPGPDPRGARQPRRQRAAAHAGRRPGDGGGRGRGDRWVRLEVRDTGSGIDPALLRMSSTGS